MPGLSEMRALEYEPKTSYTLCPAHTTAFRQLPLRFGGSNGFDPYASTVHTEKIRMLTYPNYLPKSTHLVHPDSG